MITIKQEEIYDLNKMGIYVTFFIAFFILLYPIELWVLLLLELVIIGYCLYLFACIKRNSNASIMINNEEKWFVDLNGSMTSIELKDYWFLKKYLFIWAKGNEYSVSFVVTRSIIGEQKFSQLRALIK